jgi:hypothetical protein
VFLGKSSKLEPFTVTNPVLVLVRRQVCPRLPFLDSFRLATGAAYPATRRGVPRRLDRRRDSRKQGRESLRLSTTRQIGSQAGWMAICDAMRCGLVSAPGVMVVLDSEEAVQVWMITNHTMQGLTPALYQHPSPPPPFPLPAPRVPTRRWPRQIAVRPSSLRPILLWAPFPPLMLPAPGMQGY